MAVEVTYHGRFGNNVFQYCCARFFSRVNRLKLLTPFPEHYRELLEPTPHEEFETADEPRVKLDDSEGDKLFEPRTKAHYTLDGYFQRAKWYCPRREEILGFLRPVEPLGEKNTRDIIAHLRMSDYFPTWAVHPSWYLEALSREKFERLYIVTDEVNERYFSHFKRFDPIVVNRGMAGDWNFLRSFDRIIAPNSTYAWWAIFYSEATRVYMHKRWINGQGFLTDVPGVVKIDGLYAHEKPW
jgi:hypothetical protein